MPIVFTLLSHSERKLFPPSGSNFIQNINPRALETILPIGTGFVLFNPYKSKG